MIVIINISLPPKRVSSSNFEHLMNEQEEKPARLPRRIQKRSFIKMKFSRQRQIYLEKPWKTALRTRLSSVTSKVLFHSCSQRWFLLDFSNLLHKARSWVRLIFPIFVHLKKSSNTAVQNLCLAAAIVIKIGLVVTTTTQAVQAGKKVSSQPEVKANLRHLGLRRIGIKWGQLTRLLPSLWNSVCSTFVESRSKKSSAVQISLSLTLMKASPINHRFTKTTCRNGKLRKRMKAVSLKRFATRNSSAYISKTCSTSPWGHLTATWRNKTRAIWANLASRRSQAW